MSTLPVAHDMTITRGAAFRHEFRWRRSRTDLQDFLGWSGDMVIGQPAFYSQYQLSTATGSITLTRLGRIILSLPPVYTSRMVEGVYPYVLDLTDPAGTVIRFLRGTCHIHLPPL